METPKTKKIKRFLAFQRTITYPVSVCKTHRIALQLFPH